MPAFDPTNLTAHNEGLYTFEAPAASRDDVVKWWLEIDHSMICNVHVQHVQQCCISFHYFIHLKWSLSNCQISQASWEPNDPKAARHVCKIYLGRPCRKPWFLNPNTCPALILSCQACIFQYWDVQAKAGFSLPEWLCYLYISLMVCRDTVPPSQINGTEWPEGRVARGLLSLHHLHEVLRFKLQNRRCWSRDLIWA